MTPEVGEVEEMARDFEAANAEAIAFVQGCGDGQWTTMVPGVGFASAPGSIGAW